jgi:exodeoxyribonuclease-3
MSIPTWRIGSWNVNGIRSFIVDNLPSAKFRQGKTAIEPDSNLGQWISEWNPDIICFQETRCDLATGEKFKLDDSFPYRHFSDSKIGQDERFEERIRKARSGSRYAGVAIWSKIEPLRVFNTTDLINLDVDGKKPFEFQYDEGRLLSMEFPEFWLVNTYQPNSGTNFEYRTKVWDPLLHKYLSYLKSLSGNKPVIWVGDMNIARTPIDIHSGDVRKQALVRDRLADLSGEEAEQFLHQAEERFWKTAPMKGIGKRAQAGFTKEERDHMEAFLGDGFVDTWRQLHPTSRFTGYTWWDQRITAYRQQDLGWRIDYTIVDQATFDSGRVVSCERFPHIGTLSKEKADKFGSDHCPIGIEINRE